MTVLKGTGRNVALKGSMFNARQKVQKQLCISNIFENTHYLPTYLPTYLSLISNFASEFFQTSHETSTIDVWNNF